MLSDIAPMSLINADVFRNRCAAWSPVLHIPPGLPPRAIHPVPFQGTTSAAMMSGQPALPASLFPLPRCTRLTTHSVVVIGIRNDIHVPLSCLIKQRLAPARLRLAIPQHRPVVKTGAVDPFVLDDLVHSLSQDVAIIRAPVAPIRLEPDRVEPSLEGDLQQLGKPLLFVLERLYRHRRGVFTLLVSRPRCHVADARFPQDPEKVGLVRQTLVIAVGCPDPDAVDAEMRLQQRQRGMHLVLDRSGGRGDEATTLPGIFLEQRVAVGMLLDIEQRMVNKRLECLHPMDERPSADKQGCRRVITLVVRPDHLQGFPRSFRLQRIRERMLPDLSEPFPDRKRLDIISDKKARQRGFPFAVSYLLFEIEMGPGFAFEPRRNPSPRQDGVID